MKRAAKPMGVSERSLHGLPALSAHATLWILSAVFMLPFLWLVGTSLKVEEHMMDFPPQWIPNPVTLEHYVKAFHSVPLVLFLRNTVIIAAFVVFGTLLSCSLVAYGLSMIRWKGRGWVFAVMIATMMLPFQVTMIPIFLIFKRLGWINTFLPLTVPALLGNAFYIFLLRQFFLTIPQDLIDAARVDGCNEWRIYWQIVLPLARPALATVALFTFIAAWNDFMGPLIYLVDQDKYTLSIGLAMFRGQYGTRYGELMAVSTLMTVPIVVLFFFTQKTFIQGIKTSGIKG